MKAAAKVGAAVALSGTAALSYMVFEAQWVRLVRRDVAVPALPPAWHGLVVAHLSDLHAGFRVSLNMRATAKAFRLAMSARPDLIAITGDLTGGPTNVDRLCELLRRLRAPLGVFAIAGNHDDGRTKVPFVRRTDLRFIESCGVRLLNNEVVEVVRAGARLQVAGVADWHHGRADLPGILDALSQDPAVPRLLLSHYAQAALEAPPESFHLTLSGDTHGGQICIPLPSGSVMLSDPHAQFKDGLYERQGRLIHITRGIGTSLLPLRFACRPEAVILRMVPA